MHFDQEGAPALFDQLRLGRPLLHLHAHLRVDVHSEQAVDVERLLEGFGVALLESGVHGLDLGGGERRTEIVECFHNPPGLCCQRLPFDVGNNRQRACRVGVEVAENQGEAWQHARRQEISPTHHNQSFVEAQCDREPSKTPRTGQR